MMVLLKLLFLMSVPALGYPKDANQMDLQLHAHRELWKSMAVSNAHSSTSSSISDSQSQILAANDYTLERKMEYLSIVRRQLSGIWGEIKGVKIESLDTKSLNTKGNTGKTTKTQSINEDDRMQELLSRAKIVLKKIEEVNEELYGSNMPNPPIATEVISEKTRLIQELVSSLESVKYQIGMEEKERVSKIAKFTAVANAGLKKIFGNYFDETQSVSVDETLKKKQIQNLSLLPEFLNVGHLENKIFKAFEILRGEVLVMSNLGLDDSISSSVSGSSSESLSSDTTDSNPDFGNYITIEVDKPIINQPAPTPPSNTDQQQLDLQLRTHRLHSLRAFILLNLHRISNTSKRIKELENEANSLQVSLTDLDFQLRGVYAMKLVLLGGNSNQHDSTVNRDSNLLFGGYETLSGFDRENAFDTAGTADASPSSTAKPISSDNLGSSELGSLAIAQQTSLMLSQQQVYNRWRSYAASLYLLSNIFTHHIAAKLRFITNEDVNYLEIVHKIWFSRVFLEQERLSRGEEVLKVLERSMVESSRTQSSGSDPPLLAPPAAPTNTGHDSTHLISAIKSFSPKESTITTYLKWAINLPYMDINSRIPLQFSPKAAVIARKIKREALIHSWLDCIVEQIDITIRSASQETSSDAAIAVDLQSKLSRTIYRIFKERFKIAMLMSSVSSGSSGNKAGRRKFFSSFHLLLGRFERQIRQLDDRSGHSSTAVDTELNSCFPKYQFGMRKYMSVEDERVFSGGSAGGTVSQISIENPDLNSDLLFNIKDFNPDFLQDAVSMVDKSNGKNFKGVSTRDRRKRGEIIGIMIRDLERDIGIAWRNHIDKSSSSILETGDNSESIVTASSMEISLKSLNLKEDKSTVAAVKKFLLENQGNAIKSAEKEIQIKRNTVYGIGKSAADGIIEILLGKSDLLEQNMPGSLTTSNTDNFKAITLRTHIHGKITNSINIFIKDKLKHDCGTPFEFEMKVLTIERRLIKWLRGSSKWITASLADSLGMVRNSGSRNGSDASTVSEPYLLFFLDLLRSKLFRAPRLINHLSEKLLETEREEWIKNKSLSQANTNLNMKIGGKSIMEGVGEMTGIDFKGGGIPGMSMGGRNNGDAIIGGGRDDLNDIPQSGSPSGSGQGGTSHIPNAPSAADTSETLSDGQKLLNAIEENMTDDDKAALDETMKENGGSMDDIRKEGDKKENQDKIEEGKGDFEGQIGDIGNMSFVQLGMENHDIREIQQGTSSKMKVQMCSNKHQIKKCDMDMVNKRCRVEADNGDASIVIGRNETVLELDTLSQPSLGSPEEFSSFIQFSAAATGAGANSSTTGPNHPAPSQSRSSSSSRSGFPSFADL